MLYSLSQYILNAAQGTPWQDPLSGLRVFQYITFRTAGAAVTALGLSLFFGSRIIRWLQRLKFGQDYADKAEEGGSLIARVLSKKGTPTMGGILIVAVMDLTAVLWAQWNTLVQLTLLSVLVFAGLGFYDDYAKITKQSGAGAAAKIKLAVQGALGLFIAIYLWRLPSTKALITDVMIPFYKYPVVSSAAVGILVTV
ncbi:MAG TPA: hypothetical protein VK530_09560, partial [Candidatus Acidoferrum sp.]|nr:hypothetical protein [Candidatus Acidoferrum sp.]